MYDISCSSSTLSDLLQFLQYERMGESGEYRRERHRINQNALRKARKERLTAGNPTEQDLRTVERERRRNESRKVKRRKKSEQKSKITKQQQEPLTISQRLGLQIDLGRANRAALEQIPMTFLPHKQADRKLKSSGTDKKR